MGLTQAIESGTDIRNFSEEKFPVEYMKKLVRRAGLDPV